MAAGTAPAGIAAARTAAQRMAVDARHGGTGASVATAQFHPSLPGAAWGTLHLDGFPPLPYALDPVGRKLMVEQLSWI